MTRRLTGCVLAALLLCAGPSAVAAAPVAWTLVATPLATTTGTPTTFTLTATNVLLGQIRCLWVDLPSNFAVLDADVAGSTAGNSWTSSISGNRVRVWTTSGGDELDLLDSVSFTVRATASSAGQLAWGSRSFANEGCSGSSALVSVPPIVLVTGPAVTPTPTPTPKPTPTATPVPTSKPTPRPTPRPTPTPRPLLPLPSLPSLPLPAAPDAPAGSGLTPRPTPTPSEAAAPTVGSSPPAPTTAAASPQAGAAGLAPARPPGSGPDEVVGAPTGQLPLRLAANFALRAPRPGGGIATGIGQALDGASVWFVPAATIAGPGLLLLVLVGLQSAGAVAWIPAIRRLRGEAAVSPR